MSSKTYPWFMPGAPDFSLPRQHNFYPRAALTLLYSPAVGYTNRAVNPFIYHNSEVQIFSGQTKNGYLSTFANPTENPAAQ
jgi:hypothetical protein